MEKPGKRKAVQCRGKQAAVWDRQDPEAVQCRGKQAAVPDRQNPEAVQCRGKQAAVWDRQDPEAAWTGKEAILTRKATRMSVSARALEVIRVSENGEIGRASCRERV